MNNPIATTDSELRALAQAARDVPTGRLRFVAQIHLERAASPDRILALLDRIAALEEARDTATGALAWLSGRVGDALVLEAMHFSRVSMERPALAREEASQ